LDFLVLAAGADFFLFLEEEDDFLLDGVGARTSAGLVGGEAEAGAGPRWGTAARQPVGRQRAVARQPVARRWARCPWPWAPGRERMPLGWTWGRRRGGIQGAGMVPAGARVDAVVVGGAVAASLGGDGVGARRPRGRQD